MAIKMYQTLQEELLEPYPHNWPLKCDQISQEELLEPCPFSTV